VGTRPGADVAGGVAVVGMAALFPGAPDLQTFWRNVTSGYDAITEVPSSRWAPWFFEEPGPDRRTPVDRVYCRRGGFVDEFAKVAVTRFGIPPTAVEGIEPDQLIALHVAAQAIDDAGGPTRLPDRDRIGVVLGRGGYVTPAVTRFSDRIRGSSQLVQTLRELVPELPAQALDRIRFAYHEALGPFAPENAIGLVSNLAASRLANRLDLRGPAYTVDGACASSLLAVDQAVTMLRSRRCDVMLAGGVHHCHDISFWSVFSQMRALSPTQRIRPFHRDADGTLIGEGTGVVVLKRAADALREGDRVYAVIRGVGVASDGRSASLMNPDPAGQIRAVRQAWREAGLDPTAPDAIGLIEAHGTATRAGDGAEIRTVREVFGTDGPPVALGSVKSMIGHTMPAAGVAGLIKAALAVHHALLPPTLHCDEPHPGLAGTRFMPAAQSQEWPSPERSGRSGQSGQSGPGLRRAAVNAFGFGGINAHVVLEQAPLAVGAVEPPPMVGARVRATVVTGSRSSAPGSRTSSGCRRGPPRHSPGCSRSPTTRRCVASACPPIAPTTAPSGWPWPSRMPVGWRWPDASSLPGRPGGVAPGSGSHRTDCSPIHPQPARAKAVWRSPSRGSTSTSFPAWTMCPPGSAPAGSPRPARTRNAMGWGCCGWGCWSTGRCGRPVSSLTPSSAPAWGSGAP
jgi:acyl transferase domain-containing protein